MLQNNSVLKAKIDQFWNKFWAGGISNPLTAIEQITYLLFMKRLDDLDLKQAFQDIQGDVYEYLLSEIATASKNGQFRTPRHIIKLMAELVQPQLGQRIADPACGTDGLRSHHTVYWYQESLLCHRLCC